MAQVTNLKPQHGFTLIELLIVVAIIAILAAIAVPNFLEAQTRAKASRAKADMRTIATALEAYVTDNNQYPPNDGVYNVVPRQVTTPVAYITTSLLVDPYSDKERVTIPGVDPELARYFTYTKIITFPEFMAIVSGGGPTPPVEAIDYPGFNPGAFQYYGKWRLVSNGPDRKYSGPGHPSGPFNPNPVVLLGADIPYDPTNGTVSWGNILRTQKRTEGAEPGP
jgi:type II secretion system protein G